MMCGLLFTVCLIVSNIVEQKLITIFGIECTAGLLIFPISYIINDLIAEVWGYRKVRPDHLEWFPDEFPGCAGVPHQHLGTGLGAFYQPVGFCLCAGKYRAHCGGQFHRVSVRFVPERVCNE